MNKTIFASLILAAAGFTLASAAEPKIHFSFDGNDSTQWCKTGNIVMKPHSSADQTKLISGNALRTGTDKATGKRFAIQGSMKNVILKDQGTVSFWIKPENWNGTEKEDYRIFVAANDKTPRSNEFLIYKNGANNSLYFLFGPNNPKQWSAVTSSIWKWKPGEWHFVCASWDKTMLYLTVDTITTKSVRRDFPFADYNELFIGTRNWKNEGGNSLIDDLKIYDSTLSKDEITKMFKAGPPK